MVFCWAVLGWPALTGNSSLSPPVLQVKQMSDLRKKLPETVSLVVMKNRLLEKAVEGTSFSALKPAMKGMNAFLFVHSDEIPVAIKPFR